MLHAYAKNNNLAKSLVSSFLHEMLILGTKLDEYDENLFTEYLKYPIERNSYFQKNLDELNYKT